MTPIRVKEITTGLEMKPGGVPSTAEKVHEGDQCAMLQIEPQNKQAPPQALERTVLSLSSPLVKLPPGTLVRVSAWIRIPAPITASADGALFYDTAGGEPLAIRLSENKKWTKYTLYRTVPASGQIGVTLAMTGLGAAYFDDVRIEPLTSTVPTTPVPGPPMPPAVPLLGKQ